MIRRSSISDILATLRAERDATIARYTEAINALSPLADDEQNKTPSNGHTNGHTNGKAKPKSNGKPLPKRGLLPLLVDTIARVGEPMTGPELRDALGRKAPKRTSVLNQTLARAVRADHLKRSGTRGTYRYSIPS